MQQELQYLTKYPLNYIHTLLHLWSVNLMNSPVESNPPTYTLQRIKRWTIHRTQLESNPKSFRSHIPTTQESLEDLHDDVN
jgi:hypothetical protein